MAWTAPMTAVATAVFTATQFNTNIRDNLLETAPAQAQEVSGYFIATAANSLNQRITREAIVATAGGSPETTSSTSYTNLSTVGPVATVNTGTTALVMISAIVSHNAISGQAYMGYDVSGSTAISATDDYGISFISAAANQFVRVGATFIQTGLTEGSNTFTAKYKASGATAAFNDRRISVVPF